MDTIIVTLGLARPDYTWFEEVIEFEVDDNFDPDEPNPDGENDQTFADIAFEKWRDKYRLLFAQQVPQNLKGLAKAEAISAMETPISGWWVHHWEWAERPDRPCDPDCARVVNKNDSFECTCSRSRKSG